MVRTAWTRRATSRWPWEDAARKVKLIVLYGQSNTNRAEGAGTCYPATAIDPGVPPRVFMLDCARAPGSNEDVFSATDALALVPLRDCPRGNRATGYAGSVQDPLGQTMSSIAYYLDAQDIAQGRDQCRRIFLPCGVGGRTIAQLAYGAPNVTLATGAVFSCWGRMEAMVARAVALASAMWGQACEVELIHWSQGEAEYAIGTTRSAYAAALTTLLANLRTRLAVLTGAAVTCPITLEQVASDLRGGGNPASLGVVDVADANADGNTWLEDTCYGYPFASNEDGLGTAHRIALGALARGESIGRFVDGLRNGVTRLRPRFVSTTRVGATITRVANTSLASDTSRFPDPGNLGHTLTDPGGATITGASLAGNTVTLTLSKAPAAGATLGYAYDHPSGVIASPGRRGVDWTNGQTDMSYPTPLSAKTPGMWGPLRQAGSGEAMGFAAGWVRHSFVLIDQVVL